MAFFASILQPDHYSARENHFIRKWSETRGKLLRGLQNADSLRGAKARTMENSSSPSSIPASSEEEVKLHRTQQVINGAICARDRFYKSIINEQSPHTLKELSPHEAQVDSFAQQFLGRVVSLLTNEPFVASSSLSSLTKLPFKFHNLEHKTLFLIATQRQCLEDGRHCRDKSSNKNDPFKDSSELPKPGEAPQEKSMRNGTSQMPTAFDKLFNDPPLPTDTSFRTLLQDFKGYDGAAQSTLRAASRARYYVGSSDHRQRNTCCTSKVRDYGHLDEGPIDYSESDLNTAMQGKRILMKSDAMTL